MHLNRLLYILFIKKECDSPCVVRNWGHGITIIWPKPRGRVLARWHLHLMCRLTNT